MLVLLLAAALAALNPASPVTISEIMYKSAKSSDYDYVEIQVISPTAQDLSNWWVLYNLVPVFFIAPGTVLNPGDFLVIACNPQVLLSEYDYLTSSIVQGNFTALSTSGTVSVADTSGTIMASVTYDKQAPWPELANGLGPSIEIQCVTHDPDDPLNWHASPMSVDIDSNVELLGSPGRPSTWRGCPISPSTSLPSVIISEIMYHPHDEITYREKHEFIEIYNTETFSVDVTGWRLVSENGVRFDFPSFVLNPLSFYLIVADLPSFLAIYPNVDQTRIIGSYSGEFSNGGDRVALIDSRYNSIQFLKYNDQLPWPIGADDQQNPFNTSVFVQFYGLSLARRTLDPTLDASAGENWEATSPSPGARNLVFSPYAPIVTKITVSDQNSRSMANFFSDSIISVVFSFNVPPTNPYIEYYHVDPIYQNDGPIDVLPVILTGNQKSGYVTWPSTFADNTIIRYRVKCTQGNSTDYQVSPRYTDPYFWHAFFIRPNNIVNPATRTFHAFMNPSSIQLMINEASGGRVSGCGINPNWGKQHWGILVTDQGVVVDSEMRFQGSRYNRMNGNSMKPEWFNYPSPSGLKALSWRFELPSWAKVDGYNQFFIHKILQGCTMFESPLLFYTMVAAGIHAPTNVDNVRLNVNGGYYRYGMLLPNSGSKTASMWSDNIKKMCPRKPTLKTPHIFKAQGCGCNEGPYGYGDESVLPAYCGWDTAGRHFWTYGKNSWNGMTGESDPNAGHTSQIAMCNVVQNKRTKTDLDATIDVPAMIRELVIIAWAGVWDDAIHNKFYLQRFEDNKWIQAPWDGDALYGEWSCQSGNCGLAIGNGNMKGAMMSVYPNEILQTYASMHNNLMSAQAMQDRLSAIAAKWDENEQNAALSYYGFSKQQCYNMNSNYINARWSYVNSQISSTPAPGWTPCPNVPDVIRTFTWSAFQRPPGAPVLLTLGVIFPDSTVNLTWTVPSTNGADITGYTVIRITNGDLSNPSYFSASAVDYPFYVDNTLSPSNTYTYAIIANNVNGQSGPSNIMSFFAQYVIVCTPGQTEACNFTNGQGTRTCTSSGAYWSACTLVRGSCVAGYHEENSRCVVNNCENGQISSCNITNGSGIRNCVSYNWDVCVPSSCDSGYFPYGFSCIAQPGSCITGVTLQCAVLHGQGLSTCVNDTYFSDCVASSCDSGYALNSNFTCAVPECSGNQTQSCSGSDVNADYIQQCNGAFWNLCSFSACKSGFDYSNGACSVATSATPTTASPPTSATSDAASSSSVSPTASSTQTSSKTELNSACSLFAALLLFLV